MSTSPCRVKWEISPGLAPCSITAVGPGAVPLRDPRLPQPAELHVPVIQRPFRGGLIFVGVGIPDFDRGVDVEHPPIVAPLEDFTAVDVPGQIDEKVAGRQILPEQGAEILGRYAFTDEPSDPARSRARCFRAVFELQHRDIAPGSLQVPTKIGRVHWATEP